MQVDESRPGRFRLQAVVRVLWSERPLRPLNCRYATRYRDT